MYCAKRCSFWDNSFSCVCIGLSHFIEVKADLTQICFLCSFYDYFVEVYAVQKCLIFEILHWLRLPIPLGTRSHCRNWGSGAQPQPGRQFVLMSVNLTWKDIELSKLFSSAYSTPGIVLVFTTLIFFVILLLLRQIYLFLLGQYLFPPKAIFPLNISTGGSIFPQQLKQRKLIFITDHLVKVWGFFLSPIRVFCK